MIDTFILGVPRMALDPVPSDLVPAGYIPQFAPQIGIGDRLLGGIDPTAFAPAMDPFCDPIDNIFAITPYFDGS